MYFYRISLFSIGLLLATIGCVFFVIDITLLNYGFNIFEFLGYLLSSKVFYLLPTGVILMAISLFCNKLWNKLSNYLKKKKDNI